MNADDTARPEGAARPDGAEGATSGDAVPGAGAVPGDVVHAGAVCGGTSRPGAGRAGTGTEEAPACAGAGHEEAPACAEAPARAGTEEVLARAGRTRQLRSGRVTRTGLMGDEASSSGPDSPSDQGFPPPADRTPDESPSPAGPPGAGPASAHDRVPAPGAPSPPQAVRAPLGVPRTREPAEPVRTPGPVTRPQPEPAPSGPTPPLSGPAPSPRAETAAPAADPHAAPAGTAPAEAADATLGRLPAAAPRPAPDPVPAAATATAGAAPPGDPSAPGIAALSLPYRIAAAAVLAAVAAVVCAHLAAVFLHVAPPNVVTREHGRTVDRWIYPEFEQNWRLFAPNPLQQNIAVQARAQVQNRDGELRTTGWYDLSAQDGRAIRGNPLPSHTQQNELRRAWEFWTATHGEDGRPAGLRGALSEAYLKRIVLMRLDRDGVPGPGESVERVQVRSRTVNVPPPAWSDERISTEPVLRELSWWPVVPDDLPGGDR